jgi:hypothetical protein
MNYLDVLEVAVIIILVFLVWKFDSKLSTFYKLLSFQQQFIKENNANLTELRLNLDKMIIDSRLNSKDIIAKLNSIDNQHKLSMQTKLTTLLDVRKKQKEEQENIKGVTTKQKELQTKIDDILLNKKIELNKIKDRWEDIVLQLEKSKKKNKIETKESKASIKSKPIRNTHSKHTLSNEANRLLQEKYGIDLPIYIKNNNEAYRKEYKRLYQKLWVEMKKSKSNDESKPKLIIKKSDKILF